MSETIITEPARGAAVEKPRHHFFGRLIRKPMAIVAIAWLVAIVLLSIFADQIAPFDPLKQNLLHLKRLPNAVNLLGTDALGRDVLSRLLHGGVPTLLNVIQALSVASVLGVTIGLVAGYFGGWLDRVLMQIINLIMSLPSIVILLSVLTIFDRNMSAAMIMLGIMGSAGIGRVVRSATIAVREELYIEAARISGLSDFAIILRHIVPRIKGPMIVQLSLFSAISVLVQTGLSFLGLGVPPPLPSWGGMIFEASTSLNDFPWLLVPSGLTVAFTILAFGLLGDAARDASAEGWSSTADSRRTKRVAAPSAAKSKAPPPKLDEQAALSARDITVVAGDKVLVKGINLDLRQGETLCIVGESGSGKTLTSLALIGLLPPGTQAVRGQMSFDGRTIDLTDQRALKALRGQHIGMIFQEPMAALDPCFTVGHHLSEVIRRFSNKSRSQAWNDAIELLRQVRIPDPEAVARRFPHQISGGMAQRVGIARALAPAPKILLADEPTTALDVTVQAEILDLIRSVSKSRGMSVILVTHDWGVVADICDRAMVLYDGEMLEVATVEDIFARPQHPYTQALLKANPHNAPPGQPLPTIQKTLASILGGNT